MDVILKLSPENLNVIAEKVVQIQNKKKKEAEKPAPPDEQRQYTVNEVAEMTKRTPWTIRNHIDLGLLKASKVGKSWLISSTNYNKYINNGQ